jgi:hypothetical protein
MASSSQFSPTNWAVRGVENTFSTQETDGFVKIPAKFISRAVCDAALTLAGAAETAAYAIVFAATSLPLYFISYDNYASLKGRVQLAGQATFNALKGIVGYSSYAQKVEEAKVEDTKAKEEVEETTTTEEMPVVETEDEKSLEEIEQPGKFATLVQVAKNHPFLTAGSVAALAISTYYFGIPSTISHGAGWLKNHTIG